MTIDRKPTPTEIAQVMAIFRAKDEKKRVFADMYGDMRPPIVIKHGGKLMTAFEGGIYLQTQEGPYNFVNVLHDHALMFFGVPYLEAQERKEINERHPALQWMYHSVEHHQMLLRDYGNIENDQLGFFVSWIRFAYDLYTIRDNAKLERRLKLRLLSNKDFQGARHELRVAAVAVAAGFQIKFENEADNATGHAEFVGTDQSGLKIAVEAKSRHRHGVQGFQGGRHLEPGSKVDIRNIILDAYKKKTNIPMYVFVDANLPPAIEKKQIQVWLAEIYDTMADLSKEGYADACAANTLFISNDPSHYVGNRQINNDTDALWFIHFEAKEPRVPNPTADMTERLYRAFTQRITPPSDIPDFNTP